MITTRRYHSLLITIAATVRTLGTAGVSAEGVYPGGQSENPASPWYANLIPLWWDGQYLPVPAPGSVGDDVKWTLNG